MQLYELTKIGYAASPAVDPSKHEVVEGFSIVGRPLHQPSVGRKLVFLSGKYEDDTTIVTTELKSVYVHGTDQDKLVLPSGFPDAVNLRLPEEIKDGDTLFATQNSVYLIRRLQ